MIQLTINDQSVAVEPGRTILDACREHGVDLPTFCFHPALEPYGACRLCIVEAQSGSRSPRLVAACTQPCEDGMAVNTESPAVQRSRRMTAELLLAGAYDVPAIVALAASLGVKRARMTLPESDACVLCALCVRACREIVGISAISLIHRGLEKQVAPPFQLASASCIGCATCVLICPTGRLRLKDVSRAHQDNSNHGANGAQPLFPCRLCGDTAPMRGHHAVT